MIAGSKFAYYLFISIFVAAVVVSLIYYVVNKGIFADYFSDRGELTDQLSYEYNLNQNGKDEKILISKYKQDGGKYRYFLDIENRSDLSIELQGFENDITFCEQEIVKIDESNTAICVCGFVGVHSKNLQLIKYNSSKLEFYKFIKEGAETENIHSDSPNFVFYDFNRDKKIDVAQDFRDYEKNPLYDINRMYYYFDTDRGFVYETFEKIDQSNDSLGEEGQIN